MELAVKAMNLSKRYRLHKRGESMRDRLFNPFRATQQKNEIWALENISFEIKKGQILGIIGKNGAGKSTLLKILSRITRPTSGLVEITGRMATLLEVGTGFHPELTGRENVFLNGSLLGMKRREIMAKFDEIVEYSGVEKFIDTPVKYFSTGMYVRLAFAVAAHLDPDILVIDEVLSVGDAAFQKKCLGTMKNLSESNRTVLFVTHNLNTVRNLCSRAIYLEEGKIVSDGNTEEVLKQYLTKLQSTEDLSATSLNNRLNRGSGAARVCSVSAYGIDGKERWIFCSGETINLKLKCTAYDPTNGIRIGVALISPLTGEIVTNLKDTVTQRPMAKGDCITVEVVLPKIQLRPGDFSLYIGIEDPLTEQLMDILDQNVNLPLLTITSDVEDFYQRVGYFSIPYEVRYL